jgi:4-amino-4-deoxy-L-arabinose transferase-like glycosyltransferase
MSRENAGTLTVLTVLCLPLFFWGLGRYGVVNSDEAFYQAVAERMVASGDWLRLDFRGEPRFYDSFLNAPLPHWLRAALIAAFGSKPWTMRVLSAACGAGCVLATAGLGMRLAGTAAGLAAGLVLLTTFQLVYLHGARTGELDALVTLEFVAIAWLFLRGVHDRRSFVPHHLALCALGWTKTPLVLVPLAVELGTFAASRAARARWNAWWKSALALAPLALAWHAVQLAIWWDRVPAVLAQFWGQASGARPDGAYSGRLDNALFYLRTLAWGAFPWSVVWPFALVAAWRDERLRALLAWPAAVLVFFALVAKHYAWYGMPAYPFLAIAVGAWGVALLARPAPVPLALAGVAVAAALIGVDATPSNPFAEVAVTYPMHFRPGHALGAALAAAVVLAICAFPRARPVAAAALALALLGAAALRVAGPLRQLDHEAPMDRLRAALDTAKAEGRAVAYPVRVPPGSVQIARFLFAEDHEIEARPDGSLWLYEPGDPAVLDRSIGRRGLERRLAR